MTSLNITSSMYNISRGKIMETAIVASAMLAAVLILDPEQNLIIRSILFMGMISVVWIIFHPGVSLFLTVFLMSFQRSVFADYGTALCYFPVLSSGVILGFYVLRNFDEMSIVKTPMQWLVICLFIYIMMSLWYDGAIKSGSIVVTPLSGGTEPRFRFIIQALSIFFIVSFLVNTEKRLKLIVYSLVSISLIVILIGLIQLGSLYLDYDDPVSTVYPYFYTESEVTLSFKTTKLLTSIFAGWYGNAQLGNFLVSTGMIIFPVLFYTSGNKRAKTLLMLFLTGYLICLYFSFSIGNWIAFAISVAFLYLVLGRKKIKRIYVVTCFILLVASCVYLYPLKVQFIPENASEKIADVINVVFYLKEPEVTFIRSDLAIAGLKMFIHNPVFGVGFSNYASYVDDYWSSRAYWFDPGGYSHNSYISIISELGLIGLIWFLVFIYRISKTGFSNLKAAGPNSLYYLQAGIMASIVANLVFFMDYGDWLWDNNFWLSAGLTVAVRNTLLHQKRHSITTNDNSY